MKLVVLALVLLQASIHSSLASASKDGAEKPAKLPSKLAKILESLDSADAKITKIKKLIPIYDEFQEYRVSNRPGNQHLLMPYKKVRKPLAYILKKAYVNKIVPGHSDEGSDSFEHQAEDERIEISYKTKPKKYRKKVYYATSRDKDIPGYKLSSSLLDNGEEVTVHKHFREKVSESSNHDDETDLKETVKELPQEHRNVHHTHRYEIENSDDIADIVSEGDKVSDKLDSTAEVKETKVHHTHNPHTHNPKESLDLIRSENTSETDSNHKHDFKIQQIEVHEEKLIDSIPESHKIVTESTRTHNHNHRPETDVLTDHTKHGHHKISVGDIINPKTDLIKHQIVHHSPIPQDLRVINADELQADKVGADINSNHKLSKISNDELIANETVLITSAESVQKHSHIHKPHHHSYQEESAKDLDQYLTYINKLNLKTLEDVLENDSNQSFELVRSKADESIRDDKETNETTLHIINDNSKLVNISSVSNVTEKIKSMSVENNQPTDLVSKQTQSHIQEVEAELVSDKKIESQENSDSSISEYDSNESDSDKSSSSEDSSESDMSSDELTELLSNHSYESLETDEQSTLSFETENRSEYSEAASDSQSYSGSISSESKSSESVTLSSESNSASYSSETIESKISASSELNSEATNIISGSDELSSESISVSSSDESNASQLKSSLKSFESLSDSSYLSIEETESDSSTSESDKSESESENNSNSDESSNSDSSVASQSDSYESSDRDSHKNSLVSEGSILESNENQFEILTTTSESSWNSSESQSNSNSTTIINGLSSVATNDHISKAVDSRWNSSESQSDLNSSNINNGLLSVATNDHILKAVASTLEANSLTVESSASNVESTTSNSGSLSSSEIGLSNIETNSSLDSVSLEATSSNYNVAMSEQITDSILATVSNLKPSTSNLESISGNLKKIASGLKTIASKLEDFASSLNIALGLQSIASNLDSTALDLESVASHLDYSAISLKPGLESNVLNSEFSPPTTKNSSLASLPMEDVTNSNPDASKEESVQNSESNLLSQLSESGLKSIVLYTDEESIINDSNVGTAKDKVICDHSKVIEKKLSNGDKTYSMSFVFNK